MATTTAVRVRKPLINAGTTTRRMDQKYVATVASLNYPPVVATPVEPVIRPLPEWMVPHEHETYTTISSVERDFIIDVVDKHKDDEINRTYIYFRRNYEYTYTLCYSRAVTAAEQRKEQRRRAAEFKIELETWEKYEPTDAEVWDYLIAGVAGISYAIVCEVGNGEGVGTICQCCGSHGTKKFAYSTHNAEREYQRQEDRMVNKIWFQKLLPGETKTAREFNPEELILQDEATGQSVVINWVNPK